MSGPHASTAKIRYAVRAMLADVSPESLVVVACSGGGDSMALAEAVAHEQRHASWRGGAVVVDHGLQDGSADVAATAAARVRALGLSPVDVVSVVVSHRGGGLEAAAREARYAALSATAHRLGAAVVLLGHTLDDQAEQVLLGLMRGSGARSLAGMPARRGIFRRPLLGVTRTQCRESLAAEGLAWWDDPMNGDVDFARVRARRAVADLEADLGPGIAAALGRSADLLREDADLLDAMADAAARALGEGPWAVSELEALARPIRTRVWRRLVIASGAPAGKVSTRHTDACDALIANWRGQGPVNLPGGLILTRVKAMLDLQPS